MLEAPDNKLRVDWLSSLQFNRKQYYEQATSSSDGESKNDAQNIVKAFVYSFFILLFIQNCIETSKLDNDYQLEDSLAIPVVKNTSVISKTFNTNNLTD